MDHRCQVCIKTFPSSSQLKTHSGPQSGEKLFDCRICQKLYSYSSSLRSHHITHTWEKLFPCTFCEKNLSPSPSQQFLPNISNYLSSVSWVLLGFSYQFPWLLICSRFTKAKASFQDDILRVAPTLESARVGNVKVHRMLSERLLKCHPKKTCFVLIGSKKYKEKVRKEIEYLPLMFGDFPMLEKDQDVYLMASVPQSSPQWPTG